jgi:hypothetical protein
VSPSGSDSNPGTVGSPWRTVQRAAQAVVAGDKVILRGGVYNEAVTLEGKSGITGSPIVFEAAAGETPVLDGTGLIIPTNGAKALFLLSNCSYIEVRGLELRNLATSAKGAVAVGVLIQGSGHDLVIEDNFIHDIRHNLNTLDNANAHGLAVYGEGKIPLSKISIIGNEISHCKLGSSEALVLNGNVTDFLVEDNTVHDCDNIGLDLIGLEKTCKDRKQDRARNGIVRGNTIYNIDTFYNPAYGGSPTTGGGDRSAAGLYVDGGTAILIENNHVFHCNFGVELASEASKGLCDYIILRNNLVHHNMSAGLIMGGYQLKLGATRFCQIYNNTFYQNDTAETGSGQIEFQWNIDTCTLKNNIVWASAALRQMVVHDPYDNKAKPKQKNLGVNVIFSHNRYYDGGGQQPIFTVFTQNLLRTFTNLISWQTAPTGLQTDASASYGDPGFQVAIPLAPPTSPTANEIETAAEQFRLDPTSPIRDAGDSSLWSGSNDDFFNQARVQGSGVAVGAAEQ